MYISRNMVPKMVFAVSFIWQQKKPKSVTTAAGSSSGQLPQSSNSSGKNSSIFTIPKIQVNTDFLVYMNSRHMTRENTEPIIANSFRLTYSIS